MSTAARSTGAPRLHRACPAVWLCLLAGCSTVTDRVVLLPGAPGRATGGVTVQRAATPSPETVLDTAWTEAEVGSRGPVRVGPTTAEAVQARYGALLAGRPQVARRWVLHFESGSHALVPESLALLDAIREAVLAYPEGEVVLVGHTDTVGSAADNDRLALQRAQALRERLVAAGFPADRITATGRGEREPLVRTGDEVAEPRNRRAEIKLR